MRSDYTITLRADFGVFVPAIEECFTPLGDDLALSFIPGGSPLSGIMELRFGIGAAARDKTGERFASRVLSDGIVA